MRPGSEFRVECREWTDAQLGNNDSANDVRDVNLNVAHMLSGPIEIQGAEPGDLLVVDILDLGPCQPPQEYGDAPGQGWGYTGIFAKVNGGGFLTDHFPDAYKAIWDFHGQDATSRHIPGVRYTGITHPGLFGTAPSAELLAEWNRREQALIDTDPNRVPPLALPPLEDGVLAGTLRGDELARLGREGPDGPGTRERRQPRHQELHPGQPSLSIPCTFQAPSSPAATCTSPGGRRDHLLRRDRDGRIHRLRCRPHQGRHGEVRRHDEPHAHPRPGRTSLQRVPHLHRRIRDETTGENYYLDATVAYRRACLNAMEYLKKFGYSGEQAYLLLGSAPIEGRISGVVDIPNACCSLYLPTAIFDFDIRPTKEAPQTAPHGAAAHTG